MSTRHTTRICFVTVNESEGIDPSDTDNCVDLLTKESLYM